MKIKPLFDRILVRREEPEENTERKIILPGSAKEKSNQGEVVAVGPGAVQDDGQTRPMTLSVGDRIIFGKYSDSDTIEVDEDELIIMREDDVRAVIEK